jgi:hypothetical protein
MALPHPQSRKDEYRNEDKPNRWGVVWDFFKRTINITEYRNAKDDVNPTKNGTFGALVHDWFLGAGVIKWQARLCRAGTRRGGDARILDRREQW